MNEEIKKNLKKVALETETKLARSLLRWKYRKAGRSAPAENKLESDSHKVAARAHEVIASRGRTVWNELKKVYVKEHGRKESSDN